MAYKSRTKKCFDRGGFFLKDGNYINAIKSYTRAIACSPDYATAYTARGVAYYSYDVIMGGRS